MRIEIRDLRKKDYKKAIQFAITGMHFDWYLNNKFCSMRMDGIFGILN